MSGVDVRTAVGNRAQFPAMVDAIERRRLNPEINRVFAFNARTGTTRPPQPFGKVVIVITESPAGGSRQGSPRRRKYEA